MALQQHGLLLIVALTLEVAFLVLTATLALRQRMTPRAAMVAVALGIELLQPVGGFLGGLAGTLKVRPKLPDWARSVAP